MEFLVLDLALYLAMGFFWVIVAALSFPEILAWVVICFNGLNENTKDGALVTDATDKLLDFFTSVVYSFHGWNEWGKLMIYVIPILLYLVLCHYVHIGIVYPFQLIGVIISGMVLWWFWGEIVSDSIWHVLLVILSTMLAAGMRIKLHQAINRVLPNREERDRRFVQQSESEHNYEFKNDNKATQSTDELMKQINNLSEQIAKSSHE